jgi:hypothetical protein
MPLPPMAKILDSAEGLRFSTVGPRAVRAGGIWQASEAQRAAASRALERELNLELRDHVERLAADCVRDGASKTEARHSALLEFGGLAQTQEECPRRPRRRTGTKLLQRHTPGLAQSAQSGNRFFRARCVPRNYGGAAPGDAVEYA